MSTVSASSSSEDTSEHIDSLESRSLVTVTLFTSSESPEVLNSFRDGLSVHCISTLDPMSGYVAWPWSREVTHNP